MADFSAAGFSYGRVVALRVWYSSPWWAALPMVLIAGLLTYGTWSLAEAIWLIDGFPAGPGERFLRVCFAAASWSLAVVTWRRSRWRFTAGPSRVTVDGSRVVLEAPSVFDGPVTFSRSELAGAVVHRSSGVREPWTDHRGRFPVRDGDSRAVGWLYSSRGGSRLPVVEYGWGQTPNVALLFERPVVLSAARLRPWWQRWWHPPVILHENRPRPDRAVDGLLLQVSDVDAAAAAFDAVGLLTTTTAVARKAGGGWIVDMAQSGRDDEEDLAQLAPSEPTLAKIGRLVTGTALIAGMLWWLLFD